MFAETGNPTSGLGAILLAAGGSTRLGTSKQLLDIEGQPLVVRQSGLLVNAGFGHVVVVTGADRQQVEDLLADQPVTCVHNADWEEGMGRSLACGVKAMPERIRAALVLLCDQWKIGAAELSMLTGAWQGNPQAAIVSEFEDAAGPPAILPRAMFERLTRLQGDAGARKLLKRWKGEVVSVPVPEAAVDLDLPSDLPD